MSAQRRLNNPWESWTSSAICFWRHSHLVIVLFFYFFLRWSFFTPIEKVLKERKARLAGSRKDAESLRGRAEEKNAPGRTACARRAQQIFSEQEAARRIALDERSAAIQQARSRANEEIQAARKRIAGEIEAARGEAGSGGEAAGRTDRACDSGPSPRRPGARGVQ